MQSISLGTRVGSLVPSSRVYIYLQVQDGLQYISRLLRSVQSTPRENYLCNNDMICVENVIFFSQGQRGDDDLHSLQSSMSMASEMDVVFLEEIKTTSPHFRRIRKQGNGVIGIVSRVSPQQKS